MLSACAENGQISDAFPVDQEKMQGYSPKKSLSVLLVDDDELVLEIGRRLLERMGHRVTVAEHGLQAVEQFFATPDDFQLVVLDMLMPVMDGEETCREIKRVRPEIPVLLVSGFASNLKADQLMQYPNVLFMPKPFRFQELQDAIRRLMFV